jgi:hypothetical protein
MDLGACRKLRNMIVTFGVGSPEGVEPKPYSLTKSSNDLTSSR